MTLNNPFYKVINNELRKHLESEGNSLWILDPMLDSGRQEEQIEQMIDQKVDAIILNPVNSRSLDDPLRQARKKGIPVIVIDSAMAYPSLCTTTVVSENREAGRLCARAMMDSMDSARILLLEHDLADSARERIEGFLETIEGHPEYEVVMRAECEGQLEKAMPATVKALNQDPQISVIMALNDPSALGACAAAESLGREDLSIYSVDGTPDFKTKMKTSPLLKATVAQSPYTIAMKASQSVYKARNGDDLPEVQEVGVWLITPENLDQNDPEGWQ